MRRTLASTLLIGALALVPLAATADDQGQDLEQLVVQMAHTSADHAALAEHFRDKATEARKMANRHEALVRVYTGGKFTQREAMKAHCRKLAANYNAMADEYEALAKLHDEEAKSAK